MMKMMGGEITNEIKKHTIFLGFKHVGKSRIGRELATRLNKDFIDLDGEVENFYEKNYFERLSCRKIMMMHGESVYLEMETEVLKKVLELPSCVISLGGGTPLSQMNQEIIRTHLLIHVVAPRGIVFERIMVDGRPAFFEPNEEPYESFCRLWNERNHIYQQLTRLTVDNSHTIDQAINEAMNHVYQSLKRLKT